MLTESKKPPGHDVRNRRTSPRRKIRSSAKVECRRGTLGLGPNLAAELLNISESGAGLILKCPLKTDDSVEFLVSDHGLRKAIKQSAKVCWCLQLHDGRYCAGLSFEKWLPFSDVQVIAKPS